ncbi:MAG: hypothetical protein AAGA56_11650 [Myxococcota bacterium]
MSRSLAPSCPPQGNDSHWRRETRTLLDYLRTPRSWEELLTYSDERGVKPDLLRQRLAYLDNSGLATFDFDGSTWRRIAQQVDALDDAVLNFRRAESRFVTSAWEVGRALKKIHAHELWRLRLDEEGEPKFDSFKEFASEELEISYGWAMQMVRISTTFTKRQLLHHGVTKLSAMLPALDHEQNDDEHREHLLLAAEQGASVEEIKAEARALRARIEAARDGESPEERRREAARARSARNRRTKREHALTPAEVAKTIVDEAKPLLDLNRVLELAGVDEDDLRVVDARDHLIERLEVEVRRAVVGAVRILRRSIEEDTAA